MGEWYAARRRARGTPYGRAMLSAYDSALLPELVTAKWHAWRHDDGGDAKGGGKRAEADWVEVPAVSCIAGKLGKETHEAETKAAIGELARGAAAVYLLGTLPRGLHHEWLGRYERRNASSLVNGRFVYANAGFEKKMLWYAGGAWYVGLRGQLGNARGVFSSEDTAELPEQIAKPWRVWEVAPGTTTRAKAGGGEGAWGNAPELRCLAGASGEAAGGGAQVDVDLRDGRAHDERADRVARQPDPCERSEDVHAVVGEHDARARGILDGVLALAVLAGNPTDRTREVVALQNLHVRHLE